VDFSSSVGSLYIGFVVFQPRKVLLDHLSRILAGDDALPDHMVLISATEAQGALLSARLQDRQLKVLPILSAVDIKPTLSALVNKIQKM